MYASANIMSDFARWLQEQLNTTGMTQAELARKSGVTRAAINGILTGIRGPGPDLCSAIASALGYSPEHVFRVAGLLPKVDETTTEYEKWKDTLARLNPENRERLWRIMQVELEQQEKQERAAATRPRKQTGPLPNLP